MYVKGRYRVDRHQSPFCIRTQVQKAFDDMFSVVKRKNNSLVLSYSDTGMISVYDLEQTALKYFSRSQIKLWAMDYSHMIWVERMIEKEMCKKCFYWSRIINNIKYLIPVISLKIRNKVFRIYEFSSYNLSDIPNTKIGQPPPPPPSMRGINLSIWVVEAP